MKTYFFSLAVVLCLITGSMQSTKAQNRGTQAAIDFCDCISKFIDQFHPIIRQYISDLQMYGEIQATQRLQTSYSQLSAKEQERIQEDAQAIQNLQGNQQFMQCAKQVQSQVDLFTEAEERSFLNGLMQEKRCELVRFFISDSQISRE